MGRLAQTLGLRNQYYRPMPDINNPKPETDPLPTPEDFCLVVPLFERFRFDSGESGGFFSIEHFKGTLDFHCPECGKHSVFKLMREAKYQDTSYLNNYLFSLHFTCSRDSLHQALFLYKAHKGILQKIGQIPSLVDMSLPDLKKYRPILGAERYKELSRGIGLVSHGVGIGAFVYLRRIFEWLIEKAKGSASASPSWSDEVFLRARMDEKISILKDFLPDFLVQNRGLYGILSVGVHSLSEEECLAAFPAVKLAIELILDDLLESHEREAKLKAATKSLEALKQGIQKPAA